jgi:tRNA U34 5-methylaminomethyl-2-thiouridine-forming methyltransferase MnmC
VVKLRRIITKDLSVTFHNEKFDESYKCLGGAASESRIKFVGPCRIAELARKGSIRILDVCFGLGYNSAAAIDVALESNPDCKVEIIGLENDPEVFDIIKEIDAPFKNYQIIKKLNVNSLEISEKNIKIRIILEDARRSVKNFKEQFDTVFFDPFSPKKCPELWTLEFLDGIKKVMKKGAILTTYSCATHVREKLASLGFDASDGPVFGRKSPSTVAVRQ